MKLSYYQQDSVMATISLGRSWGLGTTWGVSYTRGYLLRATFHHPESVQKRGTSTASKQYGVFLKSGKEQSLG